jgi:hypothetical protein
VEIIANKGGFSRQRSAITALCVHKACAGKKKAVPLHQNLKITRHEETSSYKFADLVADVDRRSIVHQPYPAV